MLSPDLPRRERHAVRAIILDPSGCVLLLRGREPGTPDGPAWWFTPGGGIDPGESPAQALRRECWEELGHVPAGLTGPIARRVHSFAFDGQWLVQDTQYFWARGPLFEPAPQAWSDLERRFLLGWSWWAMAELADAVEAVYPTDLARLISSLPAVGEG